MRLLSRATRLASAALALAAFAACGDETAPEPTTSQDIEIQNVFAAGGDGSARMVRANRADAGISITKIRLTVYETPGTRIVFQQVFDVDPSQTKWTLKFTAPVGSTVRLVAELISVTSGTEKVEYSGQAGPVTLNPCASTCTPIPIPTYPGPVDNLGATSVVISPDGASVVEGSTTNLTATVAPAGSYTVNWRSLNTAVATVSAAGVVTGVTAGTSQVIAAVGSKADTVTITVTALSTCTETPYTFGSSVNGTWTASDCLAASGSGRHYDMYAMTLTQQTAFTASVTGPAGRRISVRKSGTTDYVMLMASEAFMPSNSNPLQVGLILPAGTWVFEIATPDAATLGNYTLATTLGAPQGCSPIVYVWPTVTINGTIDNTDCTGPGGVGREDRYLLLPNAGTRLDLGVTTTAFAPLVVYRDDRQGPASPTLAYDIQTDVGSPARVAYTTTFAGFTEIVVGPTAPTATGNYTLSVGTASATNTCTAIASDISRRLAVWESTDCAAAGRIYDKYTFTATEQTAFQFTLSGGAATAKSAGVFRNGVEILDWGNSTTADLKAAWLLEPGSYEFRVGAESAAAGTSYSFVASDITQVGCTNNGTSGNVTLPAQTLGGTDCFLNLTGKYEDRLVLYVAAGKDIEVTMNGVDFAPTSVIRDPATPAGQVLDLDTRTTPGSVTSTFHTTVTGYYQVIFTSNAQNATGTYTGSIIIR